jgi:hypothetical protein
VFHRIDDAKDHGILGQRGLPSDSVIFGYHAKSEFSERLLATEGASGTNSEDKLPRGKPNVKRDMRILRRPRRRALKGNCHGVPPSFFQLLIEVRIIG